MLKKRGLFSLWLDPPFGLDADKVTDPGNSPVEISSICTQGSTSDQYTFQVDVPDEAGVAVDSHFTYHAATEIGSTFYDPSYGANYSTFPVLETAVNSTTPIQESSTFAGSATDSTWTCSH